MLKALLPRFIVGTTTNDNAAAGVVGEFVTATVAAGGAVALATGVASNVTSISLTAGDWKLTAQVNYTLGATTSITQLNACYSLTTATLSTQPGGSGLGTDPIITQNMSAAVPAAGVAQVVCPIRLSIASTTTVFLVSQASFTISTCAAFGTISARRMR